MHRALLLFAAPILSSTSAFRAAYGAGSSVTSCGSCNTAVGYLSKKASSLVAASSSRTSTPSGMPDYDCDGTIVRGDDLVKISQGAGKRIMEVYEMPTEDWAISAKGDESPLTRADLAANALICEELGKLYPDIPIVSEENKMKPWEERKGYKYFFCVDPLDGTKEFIKRNGQFTVNIGLCRGDTPVMGVVGAPALPEPKTYLGVVGQGAFVEVDATGHRQRIECASFSEDDEGLILVASASHNTPATEEFLAKYKNRSVKSLGSSLKLIMVATGEAHIYPRLAPTCEWDTCASHALVLAAGGVVLQHRGGESPECNHMQPLVYNKPHPLNPFFVVYGARK